MAQVCRLGPKVGGRLALFCIHRVNRLYGVMDMLRRLINCRIIIIIIILLLLLLNTSPWWGLVGCCDNGRCVYSTLGLLYYKCVYYWLKVPNPFIFSLYRWLVRLIGLQGGTKKWATKNHIFVTSLFVSLTARHLSSSWNNFPTYLFSLFFIARIRLLTA